jgi:hypothetical protein
MKRTIIEGQFVFPRLGERNLRRGGRRGPAHCVAPKRWRAEYSGNGYSERMTEEQQCQHMPMLMLA